MQVFCDVLRQFPDLPGPQHIPADAAFQHFYFYCFHAIVILVFPAKYRIDTVSSALRSDAGHDDALA